MSTEYLGAAAAAAGIDNKLCKAHKSCHGSWFLNKRARVRAHGAPLQTGREGGTNFEFLLFRMSNLLASFSAPCGCGGRAKSDEKKWGLYRQNRYHDSVDSDSSVVCFSLQIRSGGRPSKGGGHFWEFGKTIGKCYKKSSAPANTKQSSKTLLLMFTVYYSSRAQTNTYS